MKNIKIREEIDILGEELILARSEREKKEINKKIDKLEKKL